MLLPSTIYRVNYFSIVHAAIAYNMLGWFPIPLNGKRPLTTWTTDPPLTDQQLRILFPELLPLAPHLNLGIRMGRCSGLIALDIDGQAGRDFLTDRLSPADIAIVRETIQFSTPHGHRFLFEYPTTPTPSRSFRLPDHRHIEAVRILSDGTQTVAPPSDILGVPYLWIDHPYQLATWPTAIIAKLDSSQDSPRIPPPPLSALDDNNKTRRAAAWLRKCDPAISGQGGHNQTYKIAIRLVRGFQLTYHQALSMLIEIYNPTCVPPWTEIELAHKLESALKDSSPTKNML